MPAHIAAVRLECLCLQEEWDVMAANECHDISIIKTIHGHFLFVAISCFIQSFIGINSLIQDNSLIGLVSLLVLFSDMFFHHIHFETTNELNPLKGLTRLLTLVEVMKKGGENC